MPKESIVALRNAIESAPEMTSQHRDEMLTLVDSLALEVADVEAEGAADHARVEKLRHAIVEAESAVRQRSGKRESGEDHDPSERLAELEKKVELVALEHPVIANALAAIARLI